MRQLLTAAVAAASLWATACSPGHPAITPPPPSGNYTLASLSGQYAFISNGEVFTNGSSFPVPLVRVGSFTADGAGHITGGVEDVNTAGSVTNAVPITGGSYTVHPDGRGVLDLAFGQNTLEFGIVLTSTSDGLMIDETSTSSQASTGSGNFTKQDTASFAISTIAGSYVFDFAGLDGDTQSPCPCPESLIGQFTVANGVVNPGFFDDNDDGTLTSNASFTGTLSTDPLSPQEPITNSGRGIALIAGQNFVFYIVDASRVRFISTNLGMLSGDAVRQNSNFPLDVSGITGSFAFLVAGSSANGGLTRVGRFTAGNSNLSNLLVDVNDAGNEVQFNNLSNASITSYDGNTGRGTLSFSNGATTTFSFVFYLSSANDGVIQEVSGPSGTNTAIVVADGSILSQSGSPFTSSNVTGPYAMNWSGLVTSNNFQDEEDLLAQVTLTNLNLSGTADFFQFTSSTLTPLFDLGVGGSITIAGDGTSSASGQQNSMTVNLSNTAPIHMAVYMVNPQLAFFANRDNNGAQRIVAGILKAQQ